MSDIFREVDEDVRDEEYRRLWNQYGKYLIALAVSVALGTLGYQQWNAYVTGQQEAASDQFQAAISLYEANDAQAADSAFKAISESGPEGYAALAQMRRAGALAEDGWAEDAIAAYDTVATMTGVDEMVKGLAKIRAAQLLIDTGSTSDIRARIGVLANDEGPWRYAARELMAYADFVDGNLAQAFDEYERFMVDPMTPQNLRTRAQNMMAVIGPIQSTTTEPAEEAQPAATETDAAPTSEE